MIKKFVYWFADVVDHIWISIFGYDKRSHDLLLFQNILRERPVKDPKYPYVKCYWGKKTMFAIKDEHGRKYDVDCLLVNNKFVIIDHKDGFKRKYVVF